MIYEETGKIDAEKADLLKQRSHFLTKIDKKYTTEETVIRGLKEIKKNFERSSGTRKEEETYIKTEKKLKESIPFLIQKEKLDILINELNAKQKAAKKNLPSILQETKELKAEVDENRKDHTDKMENLDSLDKQLDRVSEKKKKVNDEIEKLKDSKSELQNKYYGQMIDFTKYQYLTSDIKWMNEIKEKLQVREDEKLKRKLERKERADRIKAERAERVQKELERKQKEEERREREIERKKKIEEDARENEIAHLEKLNEALEDHSMGSNPLFDNIETCEFLKRYCQKQIKKTQVGGDENKDEKEKEETKQASGKSELDKALAKGSIQLAQTKNEKNAANMAANVFTSLVSKKGARKNKKGGEQNANENQIDFQIIKKFNSLKLTVPIKEEDYPKSIEELDQMRNALVYWGKVI